MNYLTILSCITAVISIVTAEPTVETVVSKIHNLYDRIETFAAEALVYEYSG